MIEKVYIEYLIINSKSDPNHLDELLQIIQPKVFAYCKKLISDNELAKDAAQETLMDVFSKIHKLKDYRRFHAWMFQVAHNKCMDQLRKKKPHLNQPTDQTIEDQLAEENFSNRDSDQTLDIIQAMNKLPPLLKAVVTLFYYQGFSIKEISGILELPAGTIKSHLFEARKIIKHFLET